MKNSLLCALCLLLSMTTAYTSPETHEPAQETPLESQPHPTTFDQHAFLGLIEEYTHFTKTAPTNGSEECAISGLIDRLLDATAQIEFEIRNSKLAYNAASNRRSDERLRQYSDSAKTALRELNRRHGFVRALAQNSPEALAHTSPNAYRFVSLEHLNASYQSVKNILPARTRIKDCLLNSPMLTTC